MRIDKAYIVNTHQYSFRCGIPAEIIGIDIITSSIPRPCYHIKWADTTEDWVAIHDNVNYQIISFDDILNNRIPKVKL